ncbi:DNA-directed RNA polymerases I and III subunit RPAC2-like [Oratosquilla oratoria]|uniref:DNA-directed RNA polymerases I and III subunit RPAC2-like n=1 Tax=Oratosquilla oratoria TaxID=337810 RepID=UPI003F76698A
MPVGEDGFRLPTVDQEEAKNKLEIVSGGGQDEFCRTIIINDEDHTLGNTLKHVIIQNPAVQFCGYTVPHPMEKKIHVRIQSKDVPAMEILRQGLIDLKAQAEDLREMIREEVKRHDEAKIDQDET